MRDGYSDCCALPFVRPRANKRPGGPGWRFGQLRTAGLSFGLFSSGCIPGCFFSCFYSVRRTVPNGAQDADLLLALQDACVGQGAYQVDVDDHLIHHNGNLRGHGLADGPPIVFMLLYYFVL